MRRRDYSASKVLGPDHYLQEDDEPDDHGASALGVVAQEQLLETTEQWKE